MPINDLALIYNKHFYILTFHESCTTIVSILFPLQYKKSWLLALKIKFCCKLYQHQKTIILICCLLNSPRNNLFIWNILGYKKRKKNFKVDVSALINLSLICWEIKGDICLDIRLLTTDRDSKYRIKKVSILRVLLQVLKSHWVYSNLDWCFLIRSVQSSHQWRDDGRTILFKILADTTGSI